MNENKKNEEIEVLDGLEDFFDSLPEETDVKENKPVESVEEDEVLSVLDEPESDSYFSDFQPDVIEETSENVDLPEVVSDDLTPTIEPVLEPEVFSIEEPVVENPVEVPVTPEETPDVEEIEPEFGVGFESDSMMPDFTDIGSDSLEPIEITSPIEPETSDMNEMFQMNFEEPTEAIEPVQEEPTPEIPNETIDYNFMEEFAPQTNNTLDDAFQFGTVEPVEESVEVKEDLYDSDSLGKTVVIEPVEPKEVQSIPEKEEQPEEEQEASEVIPEEKTETKKSKKKQEKKKNNGRTILFVVLLSILLLAFVALMPMLLETFAV